MTFGAIAMSLAMIFSSCGKKEPDLSYGMATLICYSGQEVVFNISTKAYKITNNDGVWTVILDNGEKAEITADCIYEQIN